LLATLFSFTARGGFVGCFRRALPLGVLAPAVFRFPPLPAWAARLRAPMRLVDGVFLSPFFLPLFFAMAVLSPGAGGRQSRSAG
jgi:hypothetical protein